MGQAAGKLGKAGKGQQAGDQQSQDAQKDQEQAVKFLQTADEEVKKKQDEARKQKEQQKREKLKEMLLTMRNQQQVVNVDTDAVIKDAPNEQDLTRRNLAKLKQIAAEQGKVLEKATEVTEKVKAEATITAWLLEKVVEAMGESKKGLEGQLPLPNAEGRRGYNLPQVHEEQVFVIKRLDEIIKALDDENKRDQQQQQQGGGGGGGGGGQPLVPPAAELKLLKSMQLDINGRTRLNDVKFRPGGIDEGEAAQLRRLGDQQEQIRELTNDMIKKLTRGRGVDGGPVEKLTPEQIQEIMKKYREENEKLQLQD